MFVSLVTAWPFDRLTRHLWHLYNQTFQSIQAGMILCVARLIGKVDLHAPRVRALVAAASVPLC